MKDLKIKSKLYLKSPWKMGFVVSMWYTKCLSFLSAKKKKNVFLFFLLAHCSVKKRRWKPDRKLGKGFIGFSLKQLKGFLGFLLINLVGGQSNNWVSWESFLGFNNWVVCYLAQNRAIWWNSSGNLENGKLKVLDFERNSFYLPLPTDEFKGLRNLHALVLGSTGF